MMMSAIINIEPKSLWSKRFMDILQLHRKSVEQLAVIVTDFNL